jgi:hypothetical protein
LSLLKNRTFTALLAVSAGAMVLAVALVLYPELPTPLYAGPGDSLYPSTCDRFGVGVNPDYGNVGDFDVARLRAGWYVDWKTQLDPLRPAGLDYMQVIYTSGDTFMPDEATLAARVAANPGGIWIIGNEPECIWQGNSTPDQYARVYHELYTFLKARDPACRVTIGGIVQTTPLRLQWLDAVRERYQVLYGQPFPVDLWNIHAFILREEKGSWGCEIPAGIDATSGMLWEVHDHDRMDLFAEQIVRFRQWMKDRGERDKELIVSEYGILMPDIPGYDFDAARVEAFMLSTFGYFMGAKDPELGYPADGNRLVQRWAWYSLNDKLFEGYPSRSHLFDPDSKDITPLGLAFENYTESLSCDPYADMVPAALVYSPSTPLALDSPPMTITLTATIHNAGNTGAEDIRVQFWAGDPDHLIGGLQTIPTLAARSPASVSVDWTDVPTGTYTVGVTVDPDNLIPESDENNNQRSWTPQMDLAPAALTSSPQVPLAPDNQPITITLAAVVYNIGNTDAKDIPVQFWVGDPGHPIGGVQTIPTVPARLEAGASVEWANVTAGTYTIGVTADVDDLFSELDEDNNQFSRTLLVAEHGVYMPLVAKSYDACAPVPADSASLNDGCGDGCTHATSYPIAHTPGIGPADNAVSRGGNAALEATTEGAVKPGPYKNRREDERSR